jgi:hypothetical protein
MVSTYFLLPSTGNHRARRIELGHGEHSCQTDADIVADVVSGI